MTNCSSYISFIQQWTAQVQGNHGLARVSYSYVGSSLYRISSTSEHSSLSLCHFSHEEHCANMRPFSHASGFTRRSVRPPAFKRGLSKAGCAKEAACVEIDVLRKSSRAHRRRCR